MSTPITKLPGVGAARAELLAKLKLTTVEELLADYPRAYDDRRVITPIAELKYGDTACIRATVTSALAIKRSSNNNFYASVFITDDTGSLLVIFYNPRNIVIAEGLSYDFYGKVGTFNNQLSLTNPLFERQGRGEVTGAIVPVYNLTAGLNNNFLRRIVRSALERADGLPDPLPDEVRRRQELIPRAAALRQIHAPKDDAELEAARRRLAFDELFYLSLGLTLLKEGRDEAGEHIPVPDMTPFYSALPFSLTGAQRRSIDEALRDMTEGRQALRRMVQGDVGSGKTMVAAACAYAVAQSGAQTAMMAPTEILAAQHYKDLTELLAPLGVTTGLLSAGMSVAARREVLTGLETGELRFVVGTHALISERVTYSDLRLVITDEQHRFGVRQRMLLREKARNTPHMLVMSATPIPRTLAMVLYGDMDLSVIDELPPGRVPIDTRAPAEDKRDAVYGFMRRQIAKGRQAYVVCPMIDDNGDEDLKSAERFARELRQRYFPDLRVELLHGRMAGHEKDEIMRGFAAGNIDVLVATTVIEVGVNVPNASMIVIENAERFGLSQLHQLRGRVGRSRYKSYCVLMSKIEAPQTRARLDIMCRSNDGFEIAREDLRLRGPGEFFGERQSGIPGLKLADLGADMSLLQKAHDEASALIESDTRLTDPAHSELRKKLAELFDID